MFTAISASRPQAREFKSRPPGIVYSIGRPAIHLPQTAIVAAGIDVNDAFVRPAGTGMLGCFRVVATSAAVHRPLANGEMPPVQVRTDESEEFAILAVEDCPRTSNAELSADD